MHVNSCCHVLSCTDLWSYGQIVLLNHEGFELCICLLVENIQNCEFCLVHEVDIALANSLLLVSDAFVPNQIAKLCMSASVHVSFEMRVANRWRRNLLSRFQRKTWPVSTHLPSAWLHPQLGNRWTIAAYIKNAKANYHKLKVPRCHCIHKDHKENYHRLNYHRLNVPRPTHFPCYVPMLGSMHKLYFRARFQRFSRAKVVGTAECPS